MNLTHLRRLALLLPLAALSISPLAALAADLTHPGYTTANFPRDPDAIGRVYLGRDIAQMMGPGGIDWLDRPERVDEEKPTKVMEALELKPGEVAADIGAGSGYFTFRMTEAVGASGKVYAVEVQDAMLRTLRERAKAQNIANVAVTEGAEKTPNLPENSVDLVLMVDVYHELEYPFEMMSAIRKALKPGGRMVFVEYRKEDPAVPIKESHKMSVPQLDKEMKAVGLTQAKRVETLPWQHILIYRKEG